jgi:hypothetical protein
MSSWPFSKLRQWSNKRPNRSQRHGRKKILIFNTLIKRDTSRVLKRRSDNNVTNSMDGTLVTENVKKLLRKKKL